MTRALVAEERDAQREGSSGCEICDRIDWLAMAKQNDADHEWRKENRK